MAFAQIKPAKINLSLFGRLGKEGVAVGVGCSSPVAAFAEVDGDEIFIRGLYYSEATGKWLTFVYSSNSGSCDLLPPGA